MHELGHNMGLHHHGDVGFPQISPNYLSVMNYFYTIGIPHAVTPGSIVADEDLREVDYSEHTLNTLVESSLDESAGVSPLASGSTGITFFFNRVGGFALGPEAGPVDWSGNGVIDPGFVIIDIDGLSGPSETINGYADWVHDPCVSTNDCRSNKIREYIHTYIDPTTDPHEPCVQNRCQSLWLPFQSTRWGKAD